MPGYSSEFSAGMRSRNGVNNMNQDVFSYLRQLHQYIEAQQMRILMLEKSLKDLKQEVEQLQKRPPVHVEKIEYQFDQLKVETLDGVLNIGLSPNDPGNLENLEINQSAKLKKNVLSPMKKMEATMRLEESMHQFLDSELPSVFKEWEDKSGRKVHEEMRMFIKEDIKKQLPERINDYLQRLAEEKRTGGDELQSLIDEVEKRLKEDIKHAVMTFLNNLPKS